MLLGYSHWGYDVRETAPGYVYQYNAKETTLTLPNKTSIVVPKAVLHPGAKPRIFASPKADRIALVWDDWELVCDPNTSIPGKYRAAVIDIATKRVTPLGSGSGTGFAAFDGGGVLYLQKGRVTARIDVDDAGTVRESPLPDGVLLAPPMASDNECGF